MSIIRHYIIEPVPDEAPTRKEAEVDDELMAIFIESVTKNRAALLEALGAEDWKQVHAVAHAIKGSGASFGFPSLTEQGKAVCDAIDLEQIGEVTELTENLLTELERAVG